MTSPAEKIRQVVEDVTTAKNKMLKYACADLLDAIIAEIEALQEARREPGTIPLLIDATENLGYYTALTDIKELLKEARTSLTNSTHE